MNSQYFPFWQGIWLEEPLRALYDMGRHKADKDKWVGFGGGLAP